MRLASMGAREKDVPVIPPKDPLDEYLGSSIRLTKRLWRQLDDIAKTEDRSRNEVMEFFLKWAVETYAAEKAAAKKGGK